MYVRDTAVVMGWGGTELGDHINCNFIPDGQIDDRKQLLSW